ncbi:MAG: MoxR family ATPase [Propionibacteriaceae bacterium]|nr:MoxR family ATPase [Propionibacteriaceae bacterium]
MDSAVTVTPAQLPDLLLHLATVRPVFIWGAPGIGKSALARPMASALINRMVHVHLKADVTDWLVWAANEGLHPLILQYLTERPDHLWSPAPKAQEPFSTPRSWHILSDCMLSYPADDLDDAVLEVLTSGLLTAQHGSAFRAWIKVVRNRHSLEPIIKGEVGWPAAPEDRDVLYFLVETFRERLIRQLPAAKEGGSPDSRQFAHRAKAMLVSLAEISLEMAQLVVANDTDGTPVLPAWYLAEIVRDLPRLVAARD